MVRRFFQGLYTKEKSPDMTQESLGEAFPRLTRDQQEGLAAPFTQREVLMALKSMAALKALGPYGYQAYFFQQY